MRIRTGYSFRTAFGHLPEVMARVSTDWAPITDRASTFGFNKWTKECVKANKRPVYGVELAVTPLREGKKVTRAHWTFIATESLAPLHQLVKRAFDQFRYEPLLTYQDLRTLPEGLIAIPGRNAILKHVDIEACRSKAHLRVFAGPSTPKAQLDWAMEQGIPLIAGSDNYYPAPDDREAYEIMAGFNAQSQSFPQHILSTGELETYCGREAMDEADKLSQLCTATMLRAELLKPEKPMSLRDMCLEGGKRLGCDLERPEYAERLERELTLIAEKRYEDYFYIIADLVAYAKRHMFVGPARGSSCGSLVCFLLGITTVDPIPFGLIFERFIDITRTDLPDIDIDFSDQRRHLVFKYLEDKYGRDRVARLGTVAMYKPTSAINETAAALKVPKWRTGAFTASIVERSSGDSRALQAIEDTFKDTPAGRELIKDYPELLLAQRLEGHPRHYSQHAAGVVVTERPVEEYVAVDTRSGATQCDKKDAEDLNLLKIDALGLTQLSIFEDCLEMIGKPREWLFNYPLDDAAAFKVLNDAKWAGIFQFNGHALQSLAQQVDITEFEDIVSITALARPGPLTSGGATHWCDRKNGREAVTYVHPAFEPHLNNSLGVVMYQEQVMTICRDIGEMDWEVVSTLRKSMAKSLGKEYFNQFGDRFKAGAARLNIEEGKLNKLWDDLCAYGAWAFNRSHSVAYGYISYWCCVLKAHFPLQFAAATLSHVDDTNNQLKVLRELAKEGIGYLPVDAELSTDRWQVAEGRLIGPLTNVVGLGPKLLMEIIGGRQRGMAMPKRAQTLLRNPVTPIDELYPLAKRLRELFPDGLEAGANIVSVPVPLDKCTVEDKGGRRVVVIAKAVDINPRDHNEVGNLAKRGYAIKGPHLFLNLVLEDDTDRILARINRYNFEQHGRHIVERGDAGNAIYCLSGKILDDFRLLDVDRVKYLGSMKGDLIVRESREKVDA